MLFNSYEFIFFFLPLVLLFFHILNFLGFYKARILYLVATSLLFYCYWKPSYFILIIISISINYLLSNTVEVITAARKIILAIGLIFNLGLLAYYKYTGFFVSIINTIANTEFKVSVIILPLAISFFTFQQIAYLIDRYKGLVEKTSFLHYCLFVTFFPQLIAGPIVHHKEMMPQFNRPANLSSYAKFFSLGITFFFIGLFKKVILADNLAQFATPVFEAATNGAILTFFEAWFGVLAFTFQLYFDFSGYSDMAVGAACMFGIRLPINFYSPYQAANIVEFWKRWHVTLSRFFRDYLYIPLGGNRKGKLRTLANLIITMVLGGLWHGAGWTFVIWGGLHGIFLVVNHSWSKLFQTRTGGWRFYFTQVLSRNITFLAVVVAWVFFRSNSLETAVQILKAMTGGNHFVLPVNLTDYVPSFGGLIEFKGYTLGSITEPMVVIGWIIISYIIVMYLPNTSQLLNYVEGLDSKFFETESSRWDKIKWKPNLLWVFFILVLALSSVLTLHNVSEFLYFNF